MEIRRGRYNKSYEHPAPLEAGKPTEFAIPLRDHDHVFLKGHRIMVQVQSTWFPLIDRNPQKFVPSIATAKAERLRAGNAARLLLAAPAFAHRASSSSVIYLVPPAILSPVLLLFLVEDAPATRSPAVPRRAKSNRYRRRRVNV